jgi:hypothetical protein
MDPLNWELIPLLCRPLAVGALGSAILICLIVMTKVGLDRADRSSCYHTDNTTGIQVGHNNRYQVPLLVAKVKFGLDTCLTYLTYSTVQYCTATRKANRQTMTEHVDR